MQRECVFESLLETSSGARIDTHQFVLDLLKGAFRLRICEQVVGVLPAIAEFQILGEEDESEITHARSDWGDSHLVLGVMYARAGLLEEAEKELRALRQQNPTSEEVAGLLASVGRLREGSTLP